MEWDIMAIDENLQRYYDARFEMFASQGWKDLIEDVAAMQEATNRLDGVNTEAELMFKKGELSIIRWLLGLQDLSLSAYEQIKGSAR